MASGVCLDEESSKEQLLNMTAANVSQIGVRRFFFAIMMILLIEVRKFLLSAKTICCTKPG